MRKEGALSKQLQLKLLGSVMEFLARAGISESAIRTAFEKGLASSRRFRAPAVGHAQDSRYLPNSDVSADVLRLWHRDSRYLDDSDAKPRPLCLLKGRNSVKSLVKVFNHGANVREVLSFMKAADLIRRVSDGRYVPTAEGGTITNADPFVVEHLARSVIRLFGTVRRNTTAKREATSLIERYAYVSDLNRAESKAFAEFTKSQGLVYLQAVDDWMEQRRVRKGARHQHASPRGVLAGVQIVAYLGDETDSAEERAPASKRRGIKRPTNSPSTPA
jgi:hypothetical protein